ncbi:MAG: Nif3-like dinuclear metal center hexameric protein, partial [Flavobacteriaceae bacterium]
MKISLLLEELNKWAPFKNAEDYDNIGLLTGQLDTIVTGVLVALDSTEEVVQEAIDKNCNTIVAFHPIVFKGLKQLNGQTYV